MASTDKLINLAIAGGIVYFGIQFINSGQLQPLIDQLKGALGGLGGGAAPAPAPGGEVPATGGACDCSCMPMDGDATRRKIETAAGEDCVNHEYFGPADADALCAAKLAEVCKTRGGGSTTPAPAPGGGGGEEEEDGGEDDEESNYSRRVAYLLKIRMW